jgi:hypothetical protein
MSAKPTSCKRICAIHRLLALACLCFALAGCGGSSSSSGQSQSARSTAKQYVEQFYPLWFTYYQSQYASNTRLAGPDQVTPLYQIVVAINYDTVYASGFVDLSTEPRIITIPSTTTTYSILTLDPFGNIFDSGIPAQTPGTDGLIPPGYTGTLPSGVTPISMPLDFTTFIIRADKFSASGQDQTSEANTFRASLLSQPLSDYLADPTGGATLIVPQIVTAVPFKTAADTLLTVDPIAFLKQLQVAVESSNTPPLTADQQALSNKFNKLFGSGDFGSNTGREAQFITGAQAGYQAILNNYLSATGTTNWIHFTNIGQWGNNYLDRSSITEFIQYANGISTAAYYHTFEDGTGAALDGSVANYVLTFPAGQIPQAKRFWSVTAYTPNSIELIPNSENKWLVASYTPGLVTNPDGSISIYLAQNLPNGVPAANWLPTRNGPFNIMLRVYGPQGSVADNTYVPPAVVKVLGGNGGAG